MKNSATPYFPHFIPPLIRVTYVLPWFAFVKQCSLYHQTNNIEAFWCQQHQRRMVLDGSIRSKLRRNCLNCKY